MEQGESERRLPFIVRPEDPAAIEQLERKVVEYNDRFVEGETIIEPHHVVSVEWSALGPDAPQYPKADSYLKWYMLATVLDHGSFDADRFSHHVRDDLRMRSLFFFIQRDRPELFDAMVENASLVIDQYTKGQRSLENGEN